jgi:hypothetical protein
MELLLTIAVLLLVLWNGALFYVNMDQWFRWSTSYFSPKYFRTWQLKAIHLYIKHSVTYLNACKHVGLQLPQFLAMLYLSADHLITVLCIMSAAIVMPLSPNVITSAAVYSLIGSAVLALFAFLLSCYFKRSRMLQHLAENELEANFESSRKADSILNHSLKNRMADAAGEVELFVDECSEPHQGLLECIASLHRGMQLCQHRQAYIDIVAGKYKPRVTFSSLTDFGNALASGRELVKREFSSCWAAFDFIACEMILENALSNAFKHGCPRSPDVSFTISANTSEGSSPAQLLFVVRNRASAARPQLTDEYIQRLVTRIPESGDRRMPSTSDHVGLSHCFMIADACGIALSLKQDGDVVTFTAVVNAEIQGPPKDTPVSSQRAASRLPTGLCFHVLDDSPVARRLVVSHLLKFASPASVKVFGETDLEVQEFVSKSIGVADVVIMDEHLDYSSGNYLGSDLLKQFVNKGFRGLLCTRSANCGPADEEKYRQRGAHCVLMKEMSGLEMVATLARAYHELKASDDLVLHEI